MTETILVIRPGAIGDALLAFPALAALRAARPGAEIVLVAHPAVGELALDWGLAGRFFSRDSPLSDTLFSPRPSAARDELGPVAAVVAWSADRDGALTRNLPRLGAEPVIIAPARPPDGSDKHVAEHLLETLRPLGVGGPLADWEAPPSPERLTRRPSAGRQAPVLCRDEDDICHSERSEESPQGSRRRFFAPLRRRPERSEGMTSLQDHRGEGLARLVAIHPGSGGQHKNWPADRFAAVADRLVAERGADLLLLSGPADAEPVARFARAARSTYVTLREQPLAELVARLAACDLYLGNDSGLSHLAALSGAPTLAIFGPTDPRLWRPLGRRVEIIRSEPLDALGVDAVTERALRLLAAP